MNTPADRLRVLIDMIRARPNSSLTGEPWPIRGEWIVEELRYVLEMLTSEQHGREGPEASSDALLPE